jgi:hypothetical protein
MDHSFIASLYDLPSLTSTKGRFYAVLRDFNRNTRMAFKTYLPNIDSFARTYEAA